MSFVEPLREFTRSLNISRNDSAYQNEVIKFLFTFQLTDSKITTFFEAWNKEFKGQKEFNNTGYYPDIWRPYLRDKQAYRYWFSIIKNTNSKLTKTRFHYLFQTFRNQYVVYFSPREFQVFLAIIENQNDNLTNLKHSFNYHNKVLISTRNSLYRRHLLFNQYFILPGPFKLRRSFLHLRLWEPESRVLELLRASPWFQVQYTLGDQNINYLLEFIYPLQYEQLFQKDVDQLRTFDEVFTLEQMNLNFNPELPWYFSSGYRAYNYKKRKWNTELLYPMQYKNKVPPHAWSLTNFSSKWQQPPTNIDFSKEHLMVINALLQHSSLSIRQLQAMYNWSYRRAREAKRFIIENNLLMPLYQVNINAFNLKVHMIYLEHYEDLFSTYTYFQAQPSARLLHIQTQKQRSAIMIILHTLPNVIEMLIDALTTSYNESHKSHKFWIETVKLTHTSRELPVNLYDSESSNWQWVPLLQ